MAEVTSPDPAAGVIKAYPNTETIDRAIAVLDATERSGISPLTVGDIVVHFGLQEPSRMRRVSEVVREHTPEVLKRHNRFLTLSEKIGRIALNLNEFDQQPSATERFKQDEAFWGLMGVENAWQARAFEQEHFTHSKLDLRSNKIPPEIDWLSAADPILFARLREMQLLGRSLQFHELTSTPPTVLDSVESLAETQKNFVHTWHPQLIREGIEPIITEEEHQKHDPENGYSKEFEIINAFCQRALYIKVDEDLDQAERTTLEQANTLLTNGLAGEYVLQHTLHDYAARESESLRKALPMIIGLVAAAWGIQKYAPNRVIEALAKVAGSGDDIATELLSLPQLKLSRLELIKRMAWFMPLAAALIAADASVDEVDRSVDPHLGGLMYGSTTVGLSAASTLGSLREYEKRYQQLIAEGKVAAGDESKPGKVAREHYIYNNPARRGIVAGIIGGPAICAALWPWIEYKPYIYVPLGAIEPIGAMISIKYDEHRLGRRLKNYTRKQAERLRENR